MNLVLVAALCLLLLCVVQGGTAAPAPAPGWALVTPEAAFSIRDTAEGVVFKDRLWLSNGYYNGNVLTRDLWTSRDGAKWERVSEATPYDGYSEMVVYRGKIWAVKGSVWCSDDGLSWTQVLAQTPFGVRGYGELVVHAGEMWQLGSGEDVWHSRDGKNWVAANAHAPFGSRYASGVAAFAGRLWVMGGATERESDPAEKHYPRFTTFNDVWSSKDGVTWERVLEHAPWSPRMWFAAHVYAGRLWVLGGFSNREGANLGDVWSTRDGVHWEQLKAEPTWQPRHEPTCYTYQGSLWVVAGNCWPLMNDVWRLTLPAGHAGG